MGLLLAPYSVRIVKKMVNALKGWMLYLVIGGEGHVIKVKFLNIRVQIKIKY